MEQELTIGCPQLGLQWTQSRTRWEVGSQVEFPMAGTVLREWQASGQVLHPMQGAGHAQQAQPRHQRPRQSSPLLGKSQRQA